MRLNLKAVVLVGLIVGLGLPIGGAALYTSRTQKAELLESAKSDHNRIVEILALGMQEPIWNFQPTGAGPLMKAILDDHRVVAIKVFDAQGETFAEDGEEQRRHGVVLALEKPIQREGKLIGKARVDFSLNDAENAIQSRLRETMIITVVQLVICAALLLTLINLRVLRRIHRIRDEAQSLAKKDLETPFPWNPTDEIGDLGGALETTRIALKGLFAEIEAKNAELASVNANLEHLVAERTATIKMILDNVKSGFLVVNRALEIQAGYSRSCESLLGHGRIDQRNIADILGFNDRAREHFQIAMGQVFNDILPEDVALAQVPVRVRLDDRMLSLAGSTVRERDGRIAFVLFTIVDVTDLEKAERNNTRNEAMIRILQNAAAFRDCIRDAYERLNTARHALAVGNMIAVRMELHTLKGNSASFGLNDLSALIHSLEEEDTLRAAHLDQIEAAYRGFLDANFEFLKVNFAVDQEENLLVPRSALMSLHGQVQSAGTFETLAAVVLSWIASVGRVPAATMLGPMAQYVERLAMQLDKSVRFEIQGGDLALDPVQFKPVIQNLIHAIRNSLDHGIELTDERGAKPGTATILVAFEQKDEASVEIRVEDDGRGIDLGRLVASVRRKNLLPAAKLEALSEREKMDLIFLDGLSTAEAVSDISGRGIGMGAIKAAVGAAGGTLEVRSEVGRGTTLVIQVPVEPLPSSLRAA